eukprot:2085719-Pyramimonas_sp.AAC.1
MGFWPSRRAHSFRKFANATRIEGVSLSKWGSLLKLLSTLPKRHTVPQVHGKRAAPLKGALA